MLTRIAARRARKLWKNFVLKNHHKERDFDVVVLEIGSLYNKDSNFIAFIPNPYILDKGICSNVWFTKHCAEIELILKMFDQMSKWVNNVLENQNDYDIEQRNQAKYWAGAEKERKLIRRILYWNISNQVDVCNMNDIKEIFNV